MTRLGKLLRTTAFKLSLAYLAITALVASVVAVVVLQQTADIAARQTRAALDTEIAGLEALHDDGGIVALVRAVEQRVTQAGANVYLVASPFGEPITGNVLTIEPGVLDRGGTRQITYVRDEIGGRASEALAQIRLLDGGFRLLVGRDLEEQTRFRAAVTQALLAGAAALILLGLGGGWLVAARVGRRIDAMTATSRSIMAGDLTQRLRLAGSGDEFDRLAESVNAMLARIEALMRGLEHASTSIAHDLKTPLTRLKSRLEAALRGSDTRAPLREATAQSVEDCDALIRTFEALLTIARLEGGAGRENFIKIDLAELAQIAADLYSATAEEKGVTLTLDAPGTVVVDGHRELVLRAIANLVDNAVKYAPVQDEATGAPVATPHVSIIVRAEADAGVVVVADTGPGIPEDERGRVRERFVRLDTARSQPGTGLGLAIVEAVMRLHSGRLEFADAGPGLRASLHIPYRRNP